MSSSPTVKKKRFGLEIWKYKNLACASVILKARAASI